MILKIQRKKGFDHFRGNLLTDIYFIPLSNKCLGDILKTSDFRNTELEGIVKGISTHR